MKYSNWLLFIVIIIVTFISISSAQAPDTLWTKTYGGALQDIGISISYTSDNGYIITGYTQSFGINSDIWLLRTDSLGDTLWTKTYGDSDGDRGYDVLETIDGGYVLVGYTNPTSGGYYIYVNKTDINGDSIWSKRYGPSGMGKSIAQTPDSGFVVVGEKSMATHNDIWLLKLNQIGDTTWTRTFGGLEDELAFSVQNTSDSGYIISGYSASSGAGGADAYIVKTNSVGDSLWARTYGFSNVDVGYSAKQTTDNGYIIVGYTTDGVGQRDVYLVKTDESGDTIWTRIFGGDSTDMGYCVDQLPDCSYIITGYTYSFGNGDSDLYFLRVDSIGNIVWDTTYGGIEHDVGRDMTVNPDGSYTLVGYTTSYGAGLPDLWLVKTASDPVNVNEKHNYCIKTPNSYKISPNPFNVSLKIQGCSKVKIYNISGQFITEVKEQWDGKDSQGHEVSPGIYFLKSEGFNVGKVVKVR